MTGSSDAPWIRMATSARLEIRRAFHGDKAGVTSGLSAQYSVSEGMLRKCITSLQVLEKLEADGISYPIVIRTLQAGVTEVFGRWIKHDFAAAVLAVEAHARGESTFRDLLRNESEARPRTCGPPARKGPALDPTRPMPMAATLDRAELKAVIIGILASDTDAIPAQSLAMVGQILTRRSIVARSDDTFKVRGTWD